MTAPRRLSGRVVAFDERVGLGEIEVAGAVAGGGSSAGSESSTSSGSSAGSDGLPSEGCRFGFHCTQLADGSRTVEVGAQVDFRLLAGHGGRWEAADIRDRSPARRSAAGTRHSPDGPPASMGHGSSQ